MSFLKKKSQVAQDGLRLLDDLTNRGESLPKYIRMDRAGENKVMMWMIKRKFPGIKFELTAKDTPQQNGKLERKIATIWSRVRAMMSGA